MTERLVYISNIISNEIKAPLAPDQIMILRKMIAEFHTARDDEIVEGFIKDLLTKQNKNKRRLNLADDVHDYQIAILAPTDGEFLYQQTKRETSGRQDEKIAEIITGTGTGHGVDHISEIGVGKEAFSNGDTAKMISALIGGLNMITTINKDLLDVVKFERVTYQDIGLQRSYVTLDSFYRVLRNNGQFNEIDYEIKRVGGGDGVKTMIPERVVRCKVGSFRIPAQPAGEYDRFLRVRMSVSEFGTNGPTIPDSPNRHYQFEFTVITTGSYHYLTPAPPMDEIRFKYPITDIDSLLIRFYDPYNQIVFNNDRDIASVSSANPAVFTMLSVHNLTTGDRIRVSNYSSGTPNIDTQINGEITVTVLTATTFSVAVDTTTVAIQTNISVFYSDRRVDIPLLLESVE